MKIPFLLISPKIVPKIQLIKKGGCFEYHAVIADKIEYRYIHRASICPASGMDRRSFFMPKTMGKYKRLEVFYLSKPVYAADKPSDCHYCYYWTNGRKGCRLGMVIRMLPKSLIRSLSKSSVSAVICSMDLITPSSLPEPIWKEQRPSAVR